MNTLLTPQEASQALIDGKKVEVRRSAEHDWEVVLTGQKDPKEIIQAMLASGKQYVICWASDCNETPDKEDELVAIQEILSYTTDRPFIDQVDVGWDYVTPFDPDTGKTIIDFANDDVVLESGNE